MTGLAEGDGHGLQQGTGWVGRGGARAAEERRAMAGKPPPPQGLSSSASGLNPTTVPPSSLPSPPGGVSTGRGTGNNHLGGSRVWPTVEEGLGLQFTPPPPLVLAIGLQLQGWGEAGPQAESPPPELFFLGRVFSVLEATGYGERMMGLSLVPLHRPSFPRPWPVFSPQLWGLF